MRLGGLRNAISQISDERQLPGRRGMTYGHQNLEEGETVVLPIAHYHHKRKLVGKYQAFAMMPLLDVEEMG